MPEGSEGSPVGWGLTLLQDAGIPTSVAALVVLGAYGADKLMRHVAETRKAVGEDSRAERQLLSSDQAAFRATLLAQVESLRRQLDDAQADLDAAVARHIDAERRVVEFQVTIARLAAVLISSGIAIPAAAAADLGLTPAAHGAPRAD